MAKKLSTYTKSSEVHFWGFFGGGFVKVRQMHPALMKILWIARRATIYIWDGSKIIFIIFGQWEAALIASLCCLALFSVPRLTGVKKKRIAFFKTLQMNLGVETV